MIPAVAAALDVIVGNVTMLQNAKGAGRAFELYVMTGIASELSARGCAVRLQRSDGTAIAASDPDRTFIQRGGAPTGVFGTAQGAFNAGSIVFRLPHAKREWEIWNGVQFEGRSGGTHEIDIAIVPREVGTELRKRPAGGLPGGRPLVSIECKDVQEKGSGDEMRAFIARLYDVTILGAHAGLIAHLPVPLASIYPGSAPTSHPPFTSYWNGNRRTLNVLARRTEFRSGATAMAGYHGIQPRGPISPGSSEDTALVTDIADWIMANL